MGILLIGLVGCSGDKDTTDANSSKNDNGTSKVGYTKTSSTFTINDSNLTWQDTESIYTSTAFHTWQEADQYCQDLVLEGYDDWRLPSISEYNDDLYPYVDELTYQLLDYYDTYGNYLFWTSSRTLFNGDYDLGIYNISSGRTIIYIESRVIEAQSTRCVRDNL